MAGRAWSCKHAGRGKTGVTPMIRVLHVSPTDLQGGACLGAYNLHKALQSAGLNSLMLVLRKFSDDPSVLQLHRRLLGKIDALRDPLDRLPLRRYKWDPGNWWSVGWLPFDLRRAVKRLNPDVIQFHWAGRGAVPIRALARLSDYPLLWTLRDMWPLTGGCHYSGDCDRFAVGCGSCPQLGSDHPNDLSRWQWQSKERNWRGVPITYIALSHWMASCARRSPLSSGNDIVTIPNGVDLAHFRPLDKAAARSAWRLPTDRQIILFGALHAVRDPRKGFRYLAEAMRRLAEAGWGSRATAVVFGAGDCSLETGMPVRFVGSVPNGRLPELYSAADVMVVPSLFENSAKTAIEALACGLPVVAFGNTGQFDIVDHRLNGYLAQDRSSEDLARGIAWCLDQEARGGELAMQARRKASECFDLEHIAADHVKLYEKVLSSRPAIANRSPVLSPWSESLAAEVLAPLCEDPALSPGDGGAR